MRTFYLLMSVFLPVCCFSNGGTLMGSDFYRLNQSDFKVSSHFFAGTSPCYPIQFRFEEVRNDTLFLTVVFETRGAADALGCGRVDTLSATLQTPYSFINVSSGAITFNQSDPNLADTIWNVSDSTFNAQLSISEFGNASDLT